jgi:hypothetical protein
MARWLNDKTSDVCDHRRFAPVAVMASQALFVALQSLFKMIGRDIEGNTRIPVHAMRLQHDAGRQMQRTIAAELRTLLLDRHMGANRTVEIASHVTVETILHVMPQGITNRDILAGHLNLHDFESTRVPRRSRHGSARIN